MTQFNNCSPADISSSKISSLAALEAGEESDSDNQAPELIYKQGFESNTEGLNLSNSAKVVDNGYSEKSLRSNLSPYMTDPITGLGGSLSVMGMSTMDIKNKTNSEVYLKFWFKFDDVLWNSGLSAQSTDIFAKIYLSKSVSDIDKKQSSFVIILKGGDNGKVKVLNNYQGSNNSQLWSNWEQSDHTWRTDSSVVSHFYGETGQSFGSDGAWHLFELHIKYAQDHHLAQIKIDSKSVHNLEHTNSLGQFKLPPQFKLHHFLLFETDQSNVSNAEARTEGQHPVGVQLDELELWNKRPE